MSLRKRLISMLTALACMISMLCVFGQITTYSGNVNSVSALTGQSAKDITSQMTIGWNLGNTFESWDSSYTIDTAPKKYATLWGNPEPTKELFETVKNAGFNTVRIPTTWFQHISYNSSTQKYEIDPTWLVYIKKNVDYAYNLDMFVILNIHHEDFINVAKFTDATLADASKKLQDIWSQLSEEFKNYDQRLIFEGMNEPRQTGNSSIDEWGNGSGDNGYTWNYINTLNEVFINAVRNQGSTNNTERLLMIPGYCATPDTNGLNAIKIPSNAGNIAISVHAYLPYFFTMDTSSYSNHNFPGKDGWGNDYETSLTQLFNSLKSVSDSKGVPIVIGEFSASDFKNSTARAEWAKCYLSNAKRVGIPCVLWDNNTSYDGTGEAHGYIYRLTNTIYPEAKAVLKSIMDTVGVTNYVLPEYKEYVAPTFSWNNIPVTADWKQLYYSQSGTTLNAWTNMSIDSWKSYINSNYQLAVIYDSTSVPNIIFQGGWYQVSNDSELSEDFVAYFTYEDINKVLSQNGTSIDAINKLFVGATSSSAKIYGLYAVPVKSTQVTTTTTPVTTTTTPVTTTTTPVTTTTPPVTTTTVPVTTTTVPATTTTSTSSGSTQYIDVTLNGNTINLDSYKNLNIVGLTFDLNSKSSGNGALHCTTSTGWKSISYEFNNTSNVYVDLPSGIDGSISIYMWWNSANASITNVKLVVNSKSDITTTTSSTTTTAPVTTTTIPTTTTTAPVTTTTIPTTTTTVPVTTTTTPATTTTVPVTTTTTPIITTTVTTTTSQENSSNEIVAEHSNGVVDLNKYSNLNIKKIKFTLSGSSNGGGAIQYNTKSYQWGNMSFTFNGETTLEMDLPEDINEFVRVNIYWGGVTVKDIILITE